MWKSLQKTLPLLFMIMLVAMPLVGFATNHTDGNPPRNPTDGNAPNKENPSIELFNPLGNLDLIDFMNLVLQGLTLLAIPVVAIMVVIGAYYIITSGGSADKRSKGKNYILWAAIGFGILLLADSVAAIVKSFIST